MGQFTDLEIYDYTVKRRAEHATYKAIQEELVQLGVTNIKGFGNLVGDYHGRNISAFMLHNGVRVRDSRLKDLREVNLNKFIPKNSIPVFPEGIMTGEEMFNHIKDLRLTQHLSYRQVAEKVLALGVTRLDGKKVNLIQVSCFMTSRGLRAYPERQKRKKYKRGKYKQAKQYIAEKVSRPDVNQMETIMRSLLDIKEKAANSGTAAMMQLMMQADQKAVERVVSEQVISEPVLSRLSEIYRMKEFSLEERESMARAVLQK
jgi:hypothetical protein